jgi:hypothetical protein
MQGWDFTSRRPTPNGGGVSGRPHQRRASPRFDGDFIQDRFSPVNINEWLTARQIGFDVVYKRLHIRWKGRFEADGTTRSGVFEAQAGGMQSLPWEVEKMASKWLIYGLRGRWDATQV